MPTRSLEFICIYLGLPVLIYVHRTDVKHFAMIILLLIACFQLYVLLKDKSFDQNSLTRYRNFRHWFSRILAFFVVNATLLGAYTWYFHEAEFLRLPQEQPTLWLTVMVFYPVFSAYPQEIVFRAWIFHRYRCLFKNEMALIVVSALVFGFAHLFFGNWIAIILSTLGGFVFAQTFARSKSVFFSAIEHGLWGNFLFTIGLGAYLFTGNIE